jgi:elongation factor P
MAISATQIRKGMVIVFEGKPCKVLDARHHTPGNLRAMMQTKLRDLRTGSSFEHRFRSADTVDRAHLEQHEMEFMYADGSHYHFMNTENYEQTALSDEDLGDMAQWLLPGMKIQAEYYEGSPIGIDLPASIELTVDRADDEGRDGLERQQAGQARKRRHHLRPAFRQRGRPHPRRPRRRPLHGAGKVGEKVISDE